MSALWSWLRGKEALLPGYYPASTVPCRLPSMPVGEGTLYLHSAKAEGRKASRALALYVWTEPRHIKSWADFKCLPSTSPQLLGSAISDGGQHEIVPAVAYLLRTNIRSTMQWWAATITHTCMSAKYFQDSSLALIHFLFSLIWFVFLCCCRFS